MWDLLFPTWGITTIYKASQALLIRGIKGLKRIKGNKRDECFVLEVISGKKDPPSTLNH